MKSFALIITNIIFKLFFRVELVNIQKVPEKGPALFCANHNSLIDMFFLGYKLKIWIYWMAKDDLFKNPVLAFLLKKLGAFPVKRGTGDVGSIKSAYKLLEEGKVVGIFPQGTRVKPGKSDKFRVKPGAAMFAVNAGVPIIPAVIQGNYKLFGKIKVIYGDPFFLEADKEKKYTNAELTEMSREIIKRVYLLSEGN